MKITDVKASFHHLVVDVPVFEKPTVSRSFIFCEVNTDEGITGYGVAAAALISGVPSSRRSTKTSKMSS